MTHYREDEQTHDCTQDACNEHNEDAKQAGGAQQWRQTAEDVQEGCDPARIGRRQGCSYHKGSIQIDTVEGTDAWVERILTPQCASTMTLEAQNRLQNHDCLQIQASLIVFL